MDARSRTNSPTILTCSVHGPIERQDPAPEPWRGISRQKIDGERLLDQNGHNPGTHRACTRHSRNMMATPALRTSTDQHHRQAIAASLPTLASLLQEVLTRRLTAYIAGVKDAKTVARWANGEIAEIRDQAVEQRLRTTYEITHMLLGGDSAQTVRAWFIGLNPQLGDIPPAEAIRDGQLKEALAAARLFAVSF